MKLTAEQQRVVGAYYETYIARQQDAKAAAELNKAIEDQTGHAALWAIPDDELAKAAKETELYGLSERAIASAPSRCLRMPSPPRARMALMKIRWPIWNASSSCARRLPTRQTEKEVASILAQTPSAKEAQTASKKPPSTVRWQTRKSRPRNMTRQSR